MGGVGGICRHAQSRCIECLWLPMPSQHVQDRAGCWCGATLRQAGESNARQMAGSRCTAPWATPLTHRCHVPAGHRNLQDAHTSRPAVSTHTHAVLCVAGNIMQLCSQHAHAGPPLPEVYRLWCPALLSEPGSRSTALWLAPNATAVACRTTETNRSQRCWRVSCSMHARNRESQPTCAAAADWLRMKCSSDV